MSNERQSAFKNSHFLSKFLLPGKVALITGASRGIGKSIATAFAEAGADLVVASRKQPDLDTAAQELARTGRKVVAVQANVRNLPEIETLVKKAVDEFGHIDILVNNAGTNPVYGPVLNIDERAWEATIGLNLKSGFFLSQAVFKIMREKGGGNIINVSSAAGFRPGAGMGVYSISKAGLIMMTQVLAAEWGQYNIRVNAIAPGVVKTRFSSPLWQSPEAARQVEGKVALGYIPEPDEMAGAALYLASEA